MKKLLCPAIIAATTLLAALPLPAAQVAFNGTDAKARVADDGYIIFAYADGWDAYSQKRVEKLMASAAIRKAAGDAVLMPLAIPESPDEAARKRHEEKLGGLKVPGVWSYPALIFIDREGTHYATLSGRPVTRGTEAALAKLVADRMEKGRERRRLVAEAGKLSGPRRAETLFRATQLEGLNWMGKATNQAIRQADPKNETGLISSLDFNGHGFAGKLRDMGLAEGLAEVEKMLKNPAYTPRQKQLICVAALGTLRRKGGLDDAETMRRYARMMRDFAPDTPEGQAAEKILRDWIPGLHYGRGWNPSCIPADSRPVELLGKLPIDGPGTYTVRFQYSSGRMALVVVAVELYDGKKKIAEDRHKGVSGNNNWNNEYTLKVPARVKDPHIFVSFQQGDRDTYGKIHIEKK